MAFKCMDAVNPGGADAYSDPISMTRDSVFGLQVSWTGTLAGTLKLQFSNVEQPGTGASTDWVTDTSYTFPADPAGSASSTFEQWSGCGSRWIRLFYDHTSGTGTITALCHIKDE